MFLAMRQSASIKGKTSAGLRPVVLRATAHDVEVAGEFDGEDFTEAELHTTMPRLYN
jgi:hypothetical protein